MDILKSVYSLAAKNNGFFKSEKQAKFLSETLADNNGSFVQWFSFGQFGGSRASRTVYVKWDDLGITEIKTVADKSGKTVIKFTRQTDEQIQATKNKMVELRNADLLESIAYNERVLIALEKTKIAEVQKINNVISEVEGKADQFLIDFLSKELANTVKKYDNQISETIDRINSFRSEIV